MNFEEYWKPDKDQDYWAHSGLCVLSDDTVVFAHPNGHELVKVSNGTASQVEIGGLEAHGIEVAVDPSTGDEKLLIADPGLKSRMIDGEIWERSGPGSARRHDLEGHLELEFSDPEGDETAGSWRPTAIRDDGASVWVADGYGRSEVHRFTRDGTFVLTLNGEEAGQRFSCPHGLLIDRRGERAEFVVADRGNSRLVFYDLDGGYLRDVSHPLIVTPSALAVRDDELLIAELSGGVLAMSCDGAIRVLLPSDGTSSDEGWPNATGSAEQTFAPELRQGLMHSPHGVAVNSHGVLYVTEWCIGGRQTKHE
jgi:hypothetical protein